ncbi:hypothetical protein PVAP13_2KG203050 [Panicum virgatum]|uniref:Uncharacterized protein n=1 Tax=Panicum virgatum TaxID=38727 RepID=A0A8T0W9K3_PANVG|nr:hypothetical protein PVAP13_2KG203050 [Panicum virgatum]
MPLLSLLQIASAHQFSLPSCLLLSSVLSLRGQPIGMSSHTGPIDLDSYARDCLPIRMRQCSSVSDALSVVDLDLDTSVICPNSELELPIQSFRIQILYTAF